jgi:hypothetical protein
MSFAQDYVTYLLLVHSNRMIINRIFYSGHLAKIRYKNDLCTEENVYIQEYGDYKELIRLAKVITN